MAWTDQFQPGQPYNQNLFFPERPDLLSQRLISGTAGVRGYTVSAAPPTTFVFTRRFIPLWAVISAIIGTLLFLIGLLFLLVKQTETFTVVITEAEGGTRVAISGMVSVEMMARLQALLGIVPGLGTMPAAPMVNPPGAPSAPFPPTPPPPKGDEFTD